jgi:DNA-binding transcriptional LysR family regulator
VNNNRTDLNLLPILVALFDELNVSSAGRRLGMSQPSVSKALRKLRDTFDDPLFVRGPNGLVPTPRAHAIVKAARQHLKHLQEDLLKEEGFDPATNTQPIRLALSDVAEMALFASVIEHFRRHAPACQVSAVSATEEELATSLESGDIDLAAGYHPALSRRNFRKRLLSRHGFACLLRADHAIDTKRISTDDYIAAEHIGLRRGGSSRTLLERHALFVTDAIAQGGARALRFAVRTEPALAPAFRQRTQKPLAARADGGNLQGSSVARPTARPGAVHNNITRCTGSQS